MQQNILPPNQIKNVSFPLAGRGAYRSAEVDAFQRKVYVAYNDLYTYNAELKNKFSSLSALVDEYNEGKNSIATAIIRSQALCDKMTEDAKNQAEEIISSATNKAEEQANALKAEADEYSAEKTAKADEYLKQAETELERVKSTAAFESEKFVSEVNAQAAAIIERAKQQAAAIVAAAYADAQNAQNKCSEIVGEANEELSGIVKQLAQFKAQAKKLISDITPAVEKITVPQNVAFEATALPEAAEEEPETEKTAEFTFDPNAAAQTSAETLYEAAPAPESESEQEPHEAFFEKEQEEGFTAAQDVFDNPVFEDVSSFAQSSKDDIISPKGYNGNNTAFRTPQNGGFGAFNFDGEDVED